MHETHPFAKSHQNRPAANLFCTRTRCTQNSYPIQFGGYVRGRSKKHIRTKDIELCWSRLNALSELGRKSPPGLIETSPIGWFDLIQQPTKGPRWAFKRGRHHLMALSWKLVDSLRRRQPKVDRQKGLVLVERHAVGWQWVTRNLHWHLPIPVCRPSPHRYLIGTW
jgi:hypothetical protein